MVAVGEMCWLNVAGWLGSGTGDWGRVEDLTGKSRLCRSEVRRERSKKRSLSHFDCPLMEKGAYYLSAKAQNETPRMTASTLRKRTVLSGLHEYFFDPPRNQFAKDRRWKYGMLALFLVMLGWSIWMSCTFPQPDRDRYVRLIMPGCLILNHLSAYFYFGPRFTFPFRLFSAVFTLAGVGYVVAHVAR